VPGDIALEHPSDIATDDVADPLICNVALYFRPFRKRKSTPRHPAGAWSSKRGIPSAEWGDPGLLSVEDF